MHSSRWGLAATALCLALTVTSTPAAAAPLDSCSPTQLQTRYLVLFVPDTSTTRAEDETTDACGTLNTYYPEISVGVATSTDPDFVDRIGADRAFSAQAQRRSSAENAAAADDVRPELSLTEPDNVDTADRSPEQWGMRMINAETARTVTSGDSAVVVGVLDSGIDATHPDLGDVVDADSSASCLAGEADTAEKAWAPTTSRHGTHVAGIIAAADDGAGVTGVAPDVRLASIKVTGDRGFVDPEAVVCALMWAADQDIAVANASFFVDPWSLSCGARQDLGVAREAINRAAEYARDSGTLTVAAVTNDGVSLTPSPTGSVSREVRRGCEALPASLPSVVAVTSVGQDRAKAGYSSYGLGVVTVTAPGGAASTCVLSTVPGGYDKMCGTSMAAPHVTGVAALLASADPDAGPDELADALTGTAQQLPCPADYDVSGDGKQDAYCTGYRAFNGFYGYGLVDARAALAAVRD